MKALRWLADYWYVPVLAVAGIALLVFASFNPLQRRLNQLWLQREMEAVKAGAQARKTRAEQGAEAARDRVIQEHQDAFQTLNDLQQVEAKSLEKDPVALARYLVRAGHTG